MIRLLLLLDRVRAPRSLGGGLARWFDVKCRRLWLGLMLVGGVGLVEAEVPIEAEQTVLFYGNAMVERLLEHGELEAYLQLGHAGKNLKVRSLAWTGDEVGYRLRPDGYAEHLKTLVEKWPAQVVVLGFGMNESFAGQAGLSDFRGQFEIFLRELARRHPGARQVILSPIAVEPSLGVNAAARNRDLAAYTEALADLAARHGALFVDLFAASQAAYREASAPLTQYGLHLNSEGCSAMARVIARALLGEDRLARVTLSRLEEVAKAAAQKAHHVAVLVRIKNAVLYFGQRRRPHEYAQELPRYFDMIEQSDAVLHALVIQPDKRFTDFAAPSLPSLLDRSGVRPLSGADRGDDRRGAAEAIIRKPPDQQKEFTVAEGYRLNLFASEAEFPELKNPIQIAFDARGRLWVATMPSFPLTEPGLPYPDKVLILEDTDRDGRADKCTVFAEGFDVLDGLIFHERGVIVSAQPHLWILEDTDGDDRADKRTELIRGIDVSDTHHGGMIATDPRGNVLFSDGVFNRSQLETPFGVVRGVDATTYRMDVATGQVRVEWQSLTPNSWKVAFDRYGNLFQRYGGGQVKDGLTQTWTPIGWHHSGELGNIFNYAKGPSVTVVSSPNFPDEYQQALASTVLLGTYSVILSKVDADTGPMVDAGRFDVLTSKNPVFRPVDIEFGFDGAMYIADFCTVLIGQGPNPTRDLLWDDVHGRIWRVVYEGKPLVKDWPKIEGASVDELLTLLQHPQDLVRQHARLRLRALGDRLIPALDRWVGALDTRGPHYEQALLEATWLFDANRQVRPRLLERLLASGNPHYRTAAVQQIRIQFPQLPQAQAMLEKAIHDPHPRVQMAVINAVSHLRPEVPAVEKVLADLHAHAGPVADILATLRVGIQPGRSRSIPVLDIAPETEVRHWEPLTTSAPPPPSDPGAKGAPPPPRAYRTYVESPIAQTALLSVRHAFLDVLVNGVLIYTVDNSLSPEHQIALELEPGLNTVEMVFRRLAASRKPPSVFIYGPTGGLLEDTHFPRDEGDLSRLAAAWAEEHAADAGALRVQAVPHLMQFAPTELRVKAGEPVRLIFDNPDVMLHNFVLVAPGQDETVGLLADEMAATPEGMAKQFIPDSPYVLQATPLVEAKGRFELVFTAPAQPGRYPYLCTFPGHWRMMRGVLIVE